MVEADRTTNGWIDRQHRALTSEPMGTTLLIAVIVLVLSLLGGYAPRALAGRLTNTQLEDMTGIASGLLLTSALLLVVPEGFHVAAEAAHEAGLDEVFVFAPVTLGFTVLLGFVVMLLLEGFGIGHAVHEEHHDHAEGHGHAHVHHPTSPAVARYWFVGSRRCRWHRNRCRGSHRRVFVLPSGCRRCDSAPGASSIQSGCLCLARIRLTRASRTADVRSGDSFRNGPVVSVARSGIREAGGACLALFCWNIPVCRDVDTLPAIHNPETGRRSVRNIVIGGVIFGVLLLILQRNRLLEHSH